MKKINILLAALLVIVLASCSQPENFRVMSFNLRNSGAAQEDGDNKWDNRREAVVKLLNEECPSIFGVQEALPDQMQYLTENLPDYIHYGLGRDDGKQEGEMMAIFYRHELMDLEKCGTFWLSETPDSVSLGWDGACRRTCTWALLKLKKNGKQIMYLNTHLDHVGDTARTEAIKLIVNKISELGGADMPTFLTADFNSDTSAPRFDPLKAALSDARAQSPQTDDRTTYNAWGKGEDSMIDHIFFKNATPLRFSVLRDKDYGVPYVSDHYPVVFDCTLPE